MLLMSSMMMTVLPTPAPPKSPILPPRAYGARRSTTLMPVMRISASVDWSMNSGAGLWIGEVCLALTGPRSSTGSPTTLTMRPKVSGPTGTRIGAPVSVTSAPRTSPSVVSMAMVRTTFSPRCCATSSTSVLPWFSIWSALRIEGRSPSNFTSTTAPMTWVMVPILFFAMSRFSPLERLGARNDLDQFLGDRGLARAVIGRVKRIDHLAGVACRIVHCRHACALLRSGVLEEGGIELHGEVARQEIGENLGLLRLELVDPLLRRHNCLLGRREG